VRAPWPAEGAVYTETVVHTPPERYVSDVPYQLTILEAPTGERFTARIATDLEGPLVRIGDRVKFLEERDGVPFYSRVHN
jgi:uncharacterized OB-fold protein